MLGKKFIEDQRQKMADPIQRLSATVAVLIGAVIGLTVVVAGILVAMVSNAH